MITSQSISYSPHASGIGSSLWLNMTQTIPSRSSRTVRTGDISTMVNMALSGLSARLYTQPDCPRAMSGDDIQIEIDFYVYTSEGLSYELTPNAEGAEINDYGEILVPTSFDQIVPMSESVTLDYRLAGASWFWQTRTYAANGGTVNNIEAEIDGHIVTVDMPVFGVLRLNGQIITQHHSLSYTITKEEGYRVDNLNLSVTASWLDLNGEVQSKVLKLEIPECITNQLDTCPDGTAVGPITNTAVKKSEPNRVIVFYSSCTGDVLRIRNG